MARRFQIDVVVTDEAVAEEMERDPDGLLARLQTAMDRAWPYSRMGTVRVREVEAVGSTTPETDRIGPLG